MIFSWLFGLKKKHHKFGLQSPNFQVSRIPSSFLVLIFYFLKQLRLCIRQRLQTIQSPDLLEWFYLCPGVIVNELPIGLLLMQMAFNLIARNL